MFTQLEQIENVLFFDKKEKTLKTGTLLFAENHVYEIHFLNGEKYSYNSFAEILDNFHFGTIGINEIKFSALQKFIKKLFKI